MSNQYQKEVYRIHIVDDEMIYRRLLKEILNDPRYILSESPNGSHCINYVQSHEVDLILLDVHMPEMDGYETCKKIKSTPITSHIPVIFMTAAEKPDQVQAGYDAGGNDYVIKPFKPAVVKGRVYNILSGEVDPHKRQEIENNPPDGLSI